jgi:hypothetical protein
MSGYREEPPIVSPHPLAPLSDAALLAAVAVVVIVGRLFRCVPLTPNTYKRSGGRNGGEAIGKAKARRLGCPHPTLIVVTYPSAADSCLSPRPKKKRSAVTRSLVRGETSAVAITFTVLASVQT